jgi:hypothetical protein
MRLKVFHKSPVPIEQGGLMPSYEAACDLYRGDPKAIYKVGLGYLSRAFFIGAGLYVTGVRGEKLIRYALSGSAGVEAFVLWWVWKNSPKKG